MHRSPYNLVSNCDFISLCLILISIASNSQVNRVIDNTSDTSSENVLGNAVAASDQQQQQHVLANNPTITQAVVHSDMYPQLLQAESALQQAMSNLAQIQQAQQGSSSSLSNTPLNCDQVVADLNALCQTFAELKADGIIGKSWQDISRNIPGNQKSLQLKI